MKKFFLTTFVVCAAVITGFAQVGIGTTTPNTSSVLDLSATNKAFLPPRMTTIQRNQIASPTAGMVIYNTTTDCIEFYRSTGWYSACNGGSLPPIDGFNSSDEVAADSLVAFWKFDNDSYAEGKSSLTPEKSIGNSFTTGKIGNALNLSNGYLVFPAIPNLNVSTGDTLKNFTLSLWIKISNSSNSLWNNIFGIHGSTWGGFLPLTGITLHNNYGFINDTLSFSALLTQIDGGGPDNDELDLNPRTPSNIPFLGSNQWSHIVYSYDGPTQVAKVYANGILIGTQTFTNVTKVPLQETFNIKPFGAANKVCIGTFSFSDDGFGGAFGQTTTAASVSSFAAHGITGAIDDIRVFSTTLDAVRINSLYKLGNAGR